MKERTLHIVYAFVVLLLLVSLNLSAENDKYKGNLLVRQKQLFVKNDSLHLSMDIFFSGKVVPSALGLKLVPVLKLKKQSKDLPYVLINGKQRSAYYQREQALKPCESCKKSVDDLYTVITQQGKEEAQYMVYNVSIPYESWMKNASLLLRQIHTDCCSETLLAYEVMTKDISLTHLTQNLPHLTQKHVKRVKLDYSKHVNYVKPDAERVKMRNDFASAHINYPQGKSEVLPHFASNASELDKVKNILLPVLKNPLYTLEKITIAGYASPEGSYSSNEHLARSRSRAFRNYLMGEYNLHNGRLFSVSSVAEDWERLVELVNVYPVPEKIRVLDIIRRTQVPDERETKIRQLSNGIPYKYMYTNLYPKLRRIDVTVYYIVRPFNDTELEHIFQTNPQALSLEEMFQVARRYRPGSSEYKNAFETAVRYYPNDAVANINAAAASLAIQNVEKARFYLAKVSKDPRAYNNLGVYYLQLGDKKKAERYFVKAKRTDIKLAEKNLSLLKSIEKKN